MSTSSSARCSGKSRGQQQRFQQFIERSSGGATSPPSFQAPLAGGLLDASTDLDGDADLLDEHP
jgi:hypothetical protein